MNTSTNSAHSYTEGSEIGTHQVIDKMENDAVKFTGSPQACEDWIADQGTCFLYRVVPIDCGTMKFQKPSQPATKEISMENLIAFCEKNDFGFSIARSSGGVQFTVFIHTPIIDLEGNKQSVFSQSMFVDDAIGMTIQKAKLIQTK